MITGLPEPAISQAWIPNIMSTATAPVAGHFKVILAGPDSTALGMYFYAATATTANQILTVAGFYMANEN
jgi:hypothetical protein